MIIDDEPIIRMGLKHVINWEDLGFKIVQEAKNGNDALGKFEEKPVDLIITDIKMPQMDGLDLLKALREKNNDVCVILLSGFAEFTYAQKGIEFGAFDYILKPMNPTDIEEVLNRAYKKLMNNEKLKRSVLFSRDKVINDILQGKNLDKLYTLIKEYDLSFIRNQVQAAILELDDFEQQGEVWIQNGEYESILGKIKSIIEQEMKNNDDISSIITEGDLGSINIIMQQIDIIDDEELNKIALDVLDRILHRVKNEMQLNVTIGVGKVYETIESTCLSHFNAKESLKHKHVLGGNKIIHIEQLDSLEQNKFMYPLEEEKILISYILLGDSKATKFLGEILDQTIKNMNYELYKISICFTQMIANIYKTVQEKYSFLNEVYNLMGIKDLGFVGYKNIEEIKTNFINNISDLVDVINKYRLNKNDHIVGKACQYILEHIDEDITLTSISEYLHISKNYFCTLFKQETGENFLEYLTKAKIDRAKVLLKEDNYKIYEISDLLGYKETGYFSKLFKKYTGFTPVDYRKSDRLRKD